MSGRVWVPCLDCVKDVLVRRFTELADAVEEWLEETSRR
jgi:hypothetical protein